MTRHPFILTAAAIGLSLALAKPASALEGDWELGGMSSVLLMPERDIYGGGAEFFARYTPVDGLGLGIAAGAYGARMTELSKSLGIYTLRAGMFYSLDVLQWVPVFGIQVSSVFSEDSTYPWHRSANGIGVDFDLHVVYRGIRHLGIGLFFAYHVILTDENYMTAGLSVSWFSGMF